jgi:hypothetical protein
MAFWKKVIEHKMCVLIFSTVLFETIPILRRIDLDIYHKCKNTFMSSIRYSCQILMQLEFSWQFLKNTHILNLMKSQDVLCGCTDGWTDKQRQTGRHA